MPRPQRTKEEIDAMQARIIAAARDLIHEAGPEAATMRRIAGALGISPMTLYSYFPTRQAILHALGEQHVAWMLVRQQQQLRHARQGDVAGVIREGLAHFAGMAHRRPEMHRLVVRCMMGGESGEETHSFMCRLETQRAHLAALVRIGIERGQFAPRDADTAAIVLMSMIHGALLMQMATFPVEEDGRGSLLEETLNAVTSYLTAAGQTGAAETTTTNQPSEE